MTGVALQPTLDFSRRLAEHGNRVWIRYVLVPGLTDAEDTVQAAADHVASLGDTVERVEVLPFHRLGRDKWAKLGLTYQLADTRTPTHDELERVRGQFAAKGFTVY